MSGPLRVFVGALALISLAPLRASAQTVIFSDDFESGATKWVMQPEWHISTVDFGCFPAPPAAPSGTHVARFGQAGTCFFNVWKAWMTTASPIAIPADAQGARLRFVSYEATECGSGNCGWDDRRIFISRNGGLSWLLVWEGGYERLWIEKSVDLSAFAGNDLLIAFEFDPVDWWANDFAGWLVDDVSVAVDLPGDPTIYCSPKVNSLGCAPLMSYAGSPSMSGPDDLVLSCSNLENHSTGRFVWSLGMNSLPFNGGTLCVETPATRTLAASSGGSALPAKDCSGSYAWAFTHAYLGANALGAGTTFYVQFVGRDVGDPIYWRSLSDAVAVTLLP